MILKRLRLLLWPLAVLVLLALNWLCAQQALPIELTVQGQTKTLHAGSTTLNLGVPGKPRELELVRYDPLVHEYQLDGSDSTNNFSLDVNYLRHISSSPYYRFYAWMRGLDDLSRWRDLEVRAGERTLVSKSWPGNGERITLPQNGSYSVRLQWQLPETPRQLNLWLDDGSVLHIILNRNDRFLAVTEDSPTSGPDQELARVFFPEDPGPFVAMNLSTVVRSLLWAVILLGGVLLLELGLGWLLRWFPQRERKAWRLFSWSSALTKALHPLVLLLLLGSFLFVSWIALVQYHAMPHIFDASAYYFAAKTYAQGRLFAPEPPVPESFPGPFMVQLAGKWFAQYPPGTALTLTPGFWLGVPWLVEPLLGTLALLGIGLIAARLFNRRVASLAVLLGALSPFYSYLAASYMSHTIALFYLVWGIWGVVRYAQGGRMWSLVLGLFSFGMLALTRDLVGLLCIGLVVPGLVWLLWNRLGRDWYAWSLPLVWMGSVVILFLTISLVINIILTGNMLLPPRQLFFAGDRFGFGEGIGFYGKHTLAAGLVNLDELLTSLALDLYGWPFYCTFALLLVPFLARRAKLLDWYCLACGAVLIGAYVGYFYHGIYLGPRYLYESLPFLLMLTARGIVVLIELAKELRVRLKLAQWGSGAVTVVLVLLLLACNLGYYLPRQIERYTNYNGFPVGQRLDLDTLYHPNIHNALIIINDVLLYQNVLFPLNDPGLQGDVIYACASDSSKVESLRKAFPQRDLYMVTVGTDGRVYYSRLDSSRPKMELRD